MGVRGQPQLAEARALVQRRIYRAVLKTVFQAGKHSLSNIIFKTRGTVPPEEIHDWYRVAVPTVRTTSVVLVASVGQPYMRAARTDSERERACRGSDPAIGC